MCGRDTANGINRRFTPMDADDTTSKKGCCRIGVHLRPSAVASAVDIEVNTLPLKRTGKPFGFQLTVEDIGGRKEVR